MEIGTMSMMDISFGNNSVLKKLEKKSGNPMIHEELGNNIHIIYVYLNLPPKSFSDPVPKSCFFSTQKTFQDLLSNSGPGHFGVSTVINGNGDHWVQTCETNIWWIFKTLALIHADKSTPSPNSWQGRIRI